MEGNQKANAGGAKAPLKIAQMAVADISVGLLLQPQIKSLQNAGFQVDALSAAGPFSDKAIKNGIQFRAIPIRREPSLWHDIVCLFKLVRLFRTQKYVAVNTHTPKAGLLGPLAAKIARVPLVIHTVHGFMFHDQMPPMKRAFFWCVEKFTALFSDILFFQSEEDTVTAKAKRICSQKKIRYIGNGIDLSRFTPSNGMSAEEKHAFKVAHGIPGDALIIGCVGRLVYEKGFREVFKVIEDLIQKYPKLHFLIVGPEETKDQSDAISKSDIERMTALGRVHFLGMRQDLEKLYSIMDIFILLSHREGLPRALLEASAMGCASIATNIRGCREVIVDSQTGFLVPLFDLPETLENISRLIADPNLRRTFGDAAQRRVRELFDENKVHERIQKAYVEALSERRMWQ